MKILYAIQGTGNGHVSRAREIIPYLQKYGELDILISGTQAEITLHQDIKYQLNGFGFVFGKSGGIDFYKTLKKLKLIRLIKDMRRLPVHDYDLIINDFEPVTAWACFFKGKKSIALSHQAAYLSPKTPTLKGLHWGKWIMNRYAPATEKIGFHFERFDDFIHTPVIRSEIRNLTPKNLGHYTVYLPAYSDEFIINEVKKYPNIKWEIFSKHTKKEYEIGSIKILKINNEKFIQSLSTCEGFLTGGGFEGPAEALFFGKKLLCVPMKNQYEQQCNALALEKLGFPVIWKKSDFSDKLKDWILRPQKISLDFPDETEKMIANLMNNI